MSCQCGGREYTTSGGPHALTSGWHQGQGSVPAFLPLLHTGRNTQQPNNPGGRRLKGGAQAEQLYRRGPRQHPNCRCGVRNTGILVTHAHTHTYTHILTYTRTHTGKWNHRLHSCLKALRSHGGLLFCSVSLFLSPLALIMEWMLLHVNAAASEGNDYTHRDR